MLKEKPAPLDAVFSALADPTRRAILAALAGGSRPVSELAAPFEMSLPGFMKHLAILEEAGLLQREKEGRVVSCTLSAGPMKHAADWLGRYEQFWAERLDSLARYLYHQQELTPWKTPSRNARPSHSPATTTSRPKKSGKRGPTRKR
ncbi:MAG: transcriptional regulator [Burkholderiaceae bacterium]|nr:MAG: transcriptional regulator [Burkholderiaceae bacterium]